MEMVWDDVCKLAVTKVFIKTNMKTYNDRDKNVSNEEKGNKQI